MSQVAEELNESNLKNQINLPLPLLIELQYIQKLSNLVDSFKKALKNQDLWEATDISVQLTYCTNDDHGRDDILNTGVLKYIAKLVDPRYYSRERLMVQCSWILCNMASGESEHVKHVVDLGAIKKGIQLLKHPNHEVKQNAAWLLANISGEDLEYRDIIIKEGVVKQVEWIIKSCAPRPSLMKQVTWLMSNLLRGKPYPPFEEVCPLVEYIVYFLNRSKNTDIVTNSLWCLSYVTDGDDDHIQVVYDLGVAPKLISLVQKDNIKILAPAIRAIGNMLTINNGQANIFIENGIIKFYSELLNHDSKLMRKEACWGLSNIMADDPALVSQVLEFENGKIIKRLVEICSQEDGQVVAECMYCFRNACEIVDIQELDNLVELGVVDVVVSRLDSNLETAELVAYLEVLVTILEGYGRNPDFDKNKVVLKISEHDGWAKIEELQSHVDYEVFNNAARLIEFHFDYE